MMGLVDYEGSSESEDDEHDTKIVLPQKASTTGTQHGNLFANLPLPIKNEEVPEEADEYLNKKAEVIDRPPKRIKVSIPELSSFDEEPDSESVPVKAKKLKCGLFSILPAPKVAPLKNTCFIPKSLKQNVKSTAPLLKAATPPKAPKEPKINLKEQLVSDSDSECEESNLVSPTIIDDDTWNELFVKKKRIAAPKAKKSEVQLEDRSAIELAPEAEKPYNGLDNLAFKELVGKGKKDQPIKLIEIEEAKIHPDREEWLKSLVDPNFEASPEIKTPVNRTSLFKNHITSLAERALTNDKDLQIRWAETRNSRNQTRIKYGF